MDKMQIVQWELLTDTLSTRIPSGLVSQIDLGTRLNTAVLVGGFIWNFGGLNANANGKIIGTNFIELSNDRITTGPNLPEYTRFDHAGEKVSYETNSAQAVVVGSTIYVFGDKHRRR